MDDDECYVMCTCQCCGTKFRVSKLDVAAVFGGRYPVNCPQCTKKEKDAHEGCLGEGGEMNCFYFGCPHLDKCDKRMKLYHKMAQ